MKSSSSGKILSVFVVVEITAGVDKPALTRTFDRMESNLISLSNDFNKSDSSFISNCFGYNDDDERDNFVADGDDMHADGWLLSSGHFGNDKLYFFPIFKKIFLTVYLRRDSNSYDVNPTGCGANALTY